MAKARKAKGLASTWRCALCGHLTEALPYQWEHLKVAHEYTFGDVMQAQCQRELHGEGCVWRIRGRVVVERTKESKQEREALLRS